MTNQAQAERHLNNTATAAQPETGRRRFIPLVTMDDLRSMSARDVETIAERSRWWTEPDPTTSRIIRLTEPQVKQLDAEGSRGQMVSVFLSIATDEQLVQLRGAIPMTFVKSDCERHLVAIEETATEQIYQTGLTPENLRKRRILVAAELTRRAIRGGRVAMPKTAGSEVKN